MENETLNHRMKERERNSNLKRYSPRRVIKILRKTPESGVSSTTTPGTKPMNVT
jgi:hypothetical protein